MDLVKVCVDSSILNYLQHEIQSNDQQKEQNADILSGLKSTPLI